MANAPVKLTRRILSQSRVIAKGKRIRELNRLVERYGGRASKWVKKSSPVLEVAGQRIEYHWYEHPGIGKFELKKVQIKQT
jgi:hypothetical protein